MSKDYVEGSAAHPATALFDLGFLKNDVFTDLWIVFFKLEFFSHGSWVLRRCVEVTCPRCALEFDLYCRRFGHSFSRWTRVYWKRGKILRRTWVSSPRDAQKLEQGLNPSRFALPWWL